MKKAEVKIRNINIRNQSLINWGLLHIHIYKRNISFVIYVDKSHFTYKKLQYDSVVLTGHWCEVFESSQIKIKIGGSLILLLLVDFGDS